MIDAPRGIPDVDRPSLAAHAKALISAPPGVRCIPPHLWQFAATVHHMTARRVAFPAIALAHALL